MTLQNRIIEEQDEFISDVDGVTADFIGQLHRDVGRDIPPDVSWDFWKKWSPVESKYAELLLRSRNWWSRIPVKTGALDGIRELRNMGKKIIWCSTPYHHCEGWANAREGWLDEHFDAYKYKDAKIWARHEDKQHVGGGFFVDDRPENVEIWAARHPRGLPILYTSPVNKNQHVRYRADDWQEVISLVLMREEAMRMWKNV